LLSPGLLARAAAGLALGRLTRKRLSETGLAGALKVTIEQSGMRKTSEAMCLLAQVRTAVVSNADQGEAAGAAAGLSPRAAAARLLRHRSGRG
jgi:hypothetical protein